MRLKGSTGSVSALEAVAQGEALAGMMGGMFGCLAAQPIYDKALQDRAMECSPQPPGSVGMGHPPPPPVLIGQADIPAEEAPGNAEKELEPEEKVV